MTNIILSFIDYLKGFLGLIMPDSLFNSSFITEFATNIRWLAQTLMDVNFFIPLHTVATCLVFIVSIKIIKFGLFCQAWFVDKVTNVIP